MRRLICAIVVLSACPAWSLTFMGPPTSNLGQGQVQGGVDYSNSEYDVEFSVAGTTATLDDVEHDSTFGRLSYGVYDNLQVFGRLGLSEVADMGDEFAWGAGFKSKLTETGDVDWGMLFQIIVASGDDTATIKDFSVRGDFDIYEMQIAVGPTLGGDNFCLYGGPFAHVVSGDVDINIAGQKSSFDIKEESVLGGYVGVLLKISEIVNVAIEQQWTDNAVVFAAGLSWRF